MARGGMWLPVVVIVGLVAGLPAAGQSPGYDITMIEPPVMWEYALTQANAINNNGQVLICYSTPDYLFYTSAIWQDGNLTTVDTSASQPGGINNLGHAVGTHSLFQYPDPSEYWAVVWRDGVELNLNVTGPEEYNFANGVNDLDQVVGWYSSGTTRYAYLWDNGVVTTLAGLGGSWADALAINNAGQIAGYADDPNDIPHALIWENAGNGWVARALAPQTAYSLAYGINAAGDAVGEIDAGAGRWPALFSGGTVTILNSQVYSGYASAINTHGDIVGTYEPTSAADSVFLWRDGQFIDLNDALDESDRANWQLDQALDINDAGWIVGIGYYQGAMRGFILKPRYALGDINCDGVVGFADINAFVSVLTNPAGYRDAFPLCDTAIADINADGQVGFADINPFVALLTSMGD